MKRIVCALVALCFAFCLSACALQPAEGPLVVTATSREGHDAALAMDGDVSTGWIGARKANDTTPQILNIDLGRRVSFSKVTIDDSVIYETRISNRTTKCCQSTAFLIV